VFPPEAGVIRLFNRCRLYETGVLILGGLPKDDTTKMGRSYRRVSDEHSRIFGALRNGLTKVH